MACQSLWITVYWHFYAKKRPRCEVILRVIFHGSCSRMLQNSDISNNFALWSLWYADPPQCYLGLSCVSWVRNCTVSISLLFSYIFVFCELFKGGTGVPPGTKPETCRRCRGRGMVSEHEAQSLFQFHRNLLSYTDVWFSDLQMFMEKGPIAIQTTCIHCNGTGKTYTVYSICFCLYLK